MNKNEQVPDIVQPYNLLSFSDIVASNEPC
jgi:hypothetical protein